MRSKIVRDTKKYSRPCFSPTRGARVVYETEKQIPGEAAIRRLTSVDFPDPEGADITKMLPRTTGGL
jgi:hypothetical protein